VKRGRHNKITQQLVLNTFQLLGTCALAEYVIKVTTVTDKNYGIPCSHVIVKKATVTGLIDEVPASYKIQRPITKNTTVLRFVTP